MNVYEMNARNQSKDIYEACPNFKGKSVNGDTLKFTNYYMELNGKPFIGISGEFHFSRVDWRKWEDELIKLKMGGINIVPTYIFWNHHEEQRSQFDWNGSKNLRLFVQICNKVGLYVILRIGPFDHGEVRNGGLPDWLYGMPCEKRSNDPLYLEFVNRLYQEIGCQIKGLLFKDGGPIIGVQLENEFCHSSAPWEFTTGTSNEWVDPGRDGSDHIDILHKLALEANIEAPFYTGTAWGGAVCPTDTVLPLWGGYAFWPWIFYDENVKEHPVTPEFIYRDYHNNDVPKIYNFEPRYKPEDVLYACCEMSGGMTVFYNYRFQLPYESVSAMANVKLAGGCNFVGYYMYHGGTNPKGKLTPYLNENSTPKLSYDYQAAIGEFGQVRQSYHELKKIHYFLKNEVEQFALLKTILPTGAEQINPTDQTTLRYALRIKNDSGYLFMNNYQDHLSMHEKNDIKIRIDLENETLLIPQNETITILSGENLILPINFRMKHILLKYATAQFITSFEEHNFTAYVFFKPRNMEPEFCFKKESIRNVSSNIEINSSEEYLFIKINGKYADFYDSENNLIRIILLDNEESNHIWEFEFQGKKQVWLSNGVPLVRDNEINIEIEENELKIQPLTSSNLSLHPKKRIQATEGEYPIYIFDTNINRIFTVNTERINNQSVLVTIPYDVLSSSKETLLCVEYSGDIGYAFINGELIHDNFNNDGTWEIGLSKYKDILKHFPLYLKFTPNKENRKVKSDSPMAARSEMLFKEEDLLRQISLKVIKEIRVI